MKRIMIMTAVVFALSVWIPAMTPLTSTSQAQEEPEPKPKPAPKPAPEPKPEPDFQRVR